MEQPPQDRPMLSDYFGFAWIIVLVIQSWATIMHAFLRVPSSCGKDHFGIMAFFGWLWLLLYSQFFFPRAPGNELVWYVFLGLVPLLLIHRLASVSAKRQGRGCHNYFIGTSWFERWFPFLPVSICKPGLELIACLVAGITLAQFSMALGTFIGFGGIANMVQLELISARDRRKVDQMEDAVMEQEYLARLLEERLNQRERNLP